MALPEQGPARLARRLALYRWLIPLILSALGFGYTVWESILWDGYPRLSAQVLIGFALLGVAGPALTLFTLILAARAAAERQNAERDREQQRQQLIALNTIGESVNQSLEL
ncbi:MAG TPA: hypothetical protein VF429_05220, partial [Anaerolineae bacterium]